MPLKSLNLNLKPLIKKLENSLKRGATQELLTSTFRSVFKGRGLDFDRFRVYSPSDDAKDIDGKASLKAQDLLVRVLAEERNIDVVFLMDVSNSMVFASGAKLKCEYAAEMVAVLSFAMIEAGDRVGLVLFTDKIVKEVVENTGMNQFYKITRALSDPNLYGGDINLDVVMKITTKIFKNGTNIFLISDFIGMNDKWKMNLEIMARKFDMIGLMVRDKRDNTLEGTSGQFVVGDPFSGEDLLVDVSMAREKYGELAKQQIAEIEEKFKHVGSDFLMLDTDEEFLHPIIKLLNMRKLRWR